LAVNWWNVNHLAILGGFFSMAITIAKNKRGPEVHGSRKIVYADLTLDNSYPTGGYALTAAQFAARKIEFVEVVGGNAAAGRLLFHWDSTNKKLIALYPTGGAAASPAALADPAITAGGTGQNPVIPGRGKEVANATDLSTITVSVRVTLL
jgi:hypothetical protein